MICSTYLAGTMEQFQPVGKAGDQDNHNANYGGWVQNNRINSAIFR